MATLAHAAAPALGERSRLERSRFSATVPVLGLIAALVIGGFVRLWGLTGQSLFLDEAFAFDAAGRPLHDLLMQIVQHDAHPPLFYLCTHWLMSAFPQLSERSYRWFTAPIGLLTVAATWGIGRRLFGDAAAAIAALVVATEPSLVELDRIYRMYAPLAALTMASWWLLLSFPDARGRARTWCAGAYVLCAALLPSIQYLGGAVLVAQLAYAFFRRRRDAAPTASASEQRPLFGLTCAGIAAAAVALAWWVPWALPTQFRQGGYAGAGAIAQSWWEVPNGALGYGLPIDWYRTPVFGEIFAAGAIGIAIAGAWIGRKSMLPWAYGPLALQLALGAATGKDLVLSRYLLPAVPVFALSIGAISAALFTTRVRALGLVLVLSVVGLNGVALTNELVDHFYQTPDWDLAGSIVAQHTTPGDRFVLDDGYPYLILRSMPAFAGHAIDAPTAASQIPSTLAFADLLPRVRVWYVENEFYYVDPQRRVLAHLEATRPRLREWLEPRADLSNRVYIALFGAERVHHR